MVCLGDCYLSVTWCSYVSCPFVIFGQLESEVLILNSIQVINISKSTITINYFEELYVDLIESVYWRSTRLIYRGSRHQNNVLVFLVIERSVIVKDPCIDDIDSNNWLYISFDLSIKIGR